MYHSDLQNQLTSEVFQKPNTLNLYAVIINTLIIGIYIINKVEGISSLLILCRKSNDLNDKNGCEVTFNLKFKWLPKSLHQDHYEILR